MKKFSFIFCLLISFNSFSQDSASRNLPEFPQQLGRVNDFMGLFAKEEVKSLDSLIGRIQSQTSIRVVVTTIDSPMLAHLSLEEFSLQLLHKWGVGEKKKNNGILIVIAPAMQRMRVENGYGIETYLSNEQTKEIVDSVFITQFKQGNFFDGTKNGIIAIIKKLQQNGYQ